MKTQIRYVPLDLPNLGRMELRCPEWNDVAFDIWNEYYDIFKAHSPEWTKIAFYLIGMASRAVIDSEYLSLGDACYRDSVVVAVRNVFYQAAVAESRWTRISKLALDGPILDYGCGVGFLLRYMQEHGVRAEMYAYEVPGFQRDIVTPYLASHGITMLNGLDDPRAPSRFGTILCIHVLEHLHNPMDMLRRLESRTDHLYANCDDSEGPGHEATSSDTRAAVCDALRVGGHEIPA